MNRVDERDLIWRCQRRDLAAFEALYRQYSPLALRTAFLFTRSRPEAEEAVQEAFIQVWRRIETLRDPAAYRSWFYRILLHAAHQARRQPVTVPLELDKHDQADPTSPVPAELAEHWEELQELRRALAQLPNLHRAPLILRYYSKLSDLEIAKVLDIPVGTVKSRLYNARQVLHDHLEKGGRSHG